LWRLRHQNNKIYLGFVKQSFSAQVNWAEKRLHFFKRGDAEMSRDLKILEFNDETTVDSSQTDEARQDMSDLKEGDRVTIYYDDQNVIYRVEIEPDEES
jgi:hypothetical protein